VARREKADSLAFLFPALGIRGKARFVLSHAASAKAGAQPKPQIFEVYFIYLSQLVTRTFLRFTCRE
jgi:hypothetical protein